MLSFLFALLLGTALKAVCCAAVVHRLRASGGNLLRGRWSQASRPNLICCKLVEDGNIVVLVQARIVDVAMCQSGARVWLTSTVQYVMCWSAL